MAFPLQLLGTFLPTKLDPVGVALLALAGCYASWHLLRQRGVRQESSVQTWVWVAVIVLSGVLAAERIHALPSLGITSFLILADTALLVAAVFLIASLAAMVRAKGAEQAELQRALNQAKVAAGEASRAKTDFLTVMSHEVRTPLNAVMGFTSLLADSRLDPVQRDYVATITSEGRRLESLLNDLLDLSKIEQGQLVLEDLPFAPTETARDVLQLFGGQAQEKMLDLRLEAQLAGPLLVAGDAHRFRQILGNLVENAIKFTPRGSVTLFLHWMPPGAGDTKGRLGVRVRDTGIGIPADKLPDLFQNFMQADASTARRYGGTGLGLAICQRLVGMMGGRISVQSILGQGTEFSFSIGLAEVAVPAPTAAPFPVVPASASTTPRILVVDDMETNRFLLEIFLRRSGFEPELAAGGEEAVQLATRKCYDAILMDLQMPDIDGYTATRRIRESEPPGRRTPIFALTASIAQGTREKCFAAGMDEYLTKPLDVKKFKSLLNSLIAGGRAGPRRTPSSVPARVAA